ncbi:Undecaprenyl-phosphate mannosyltransferase [Gimesia aquarii]|uniref:Undecaprenyl-phosphate mannosyltransferase n=2 Tax=Gimesia aquarii TaxID=2527964 RepID=A0A517VUS0_9PLAN|nr:Undecaprenyl-phosphate mannosyltransferase [Gimesia aquarii]
MLCGYSYIANGYYNTSNLNSKNIFPTAALQLDLHYFMSTNSSHQSELASPKGRVVAVMPAYNAASTLERTVADIPTGSVDEIVLVDDCSSDNTVEVAKRLGLTVIQHERNTGYGGNQKTCYRYALEAGADYVVMIHPDYQYDSRVVTIAVELIRLGISDVILGSRIRTRAEALEGGMPLYKYIANRILTIIENMALGQNLGDFHSGFRAYRREVLEKIPFEKNSDDFVFDSQFLAQTVRFGFKLGDIPVPVRYFEEASSINFKRSARYGLLTLGVLVQYWGNRLGILKSEIFSGNNQYLVD